MPCKHKIKETGTVILERCNEMIERFESQIADKLEQKDRHKAKYNDKEKDLLIKKIQDNPNDCWVVTDTGIVNFKLE